MKPYKPSPWRPPIQDTSLEVLLTNPLKRSEWLRSKRLAIVPDRAVSLDDPQPFTLCAVRIKKGALTGPLTELPIDWYEVIDKVQNIRDMDYYQAEQRLFTRLYQMAGEVTIADTISVDDASGATVRKLLRRLRDSSPSHIQARKQELEELQERIEYALTVYEDQGRDTTFLEARRDATEEALEALEVGNLEVARQALEEAIYG